MGRRSNGGKREGRRGKVEEIWEGGEQEGEGGGQSGGGKGGKWGGEQEGGGKGRERRERMGKDKINLISEGVCIAHIYTSNIVLLKLDNRNFEANVPHPKLSHQETCDL